MNRYLVYGTGKSGISAATLLLRHNEEVVLFDENEYFDTRKFYDENPELKEVPIALGELDRTLLNSIETVVLSPGVPLDHELVQAFYKSRKNIIGELELGFLYEKGNVLAITGTNGKTTTTSLVGHICKTAGIKTFVAGNIGNPYTSICDSTTKDSVSVIEVSSFQLETIKTFSPKICSILNITPDHLDRHKTFENYCKVKKSITNNLKDDGVCILNYEDENLNGFDKEISQRVVYYSSKRGLPEGLFYKDNGIFFADKNGIKKVIDTDKLNLLGVHNFENIMAGIGMCISYGIEIDIIRNALMTFTAVEHRIEFVCEKAGVKYYNDSKSTNVDAAIKGVTAMERPVILIGGGYSKGADYTEWIKAFNGNVKHLILIGESAKDIARTCEQNGFGDYSFYDTFESAVNSAINRADKGDCVLLSPACASWGMFKNYEERGKLFKELVTGIER